VRFNLYACHVASDHSSVLTKHPTTKQWLAYLSTICHPVCIHKPSQWFMFLTTWWPCTYTVSNTFSILGCYVCHIRPHSLRRHCKRVGHSPHVSLATCPSYCCLGDTCYARDFIAAWLLAAGWLAPTCVKWRSREICAACFWTERLVVIDLLDSAHTTSSRLESLKYG